MNERLPGNTGPAKAEFCSGSGTRLLYSEAEVPGGRINANRRAVGRRRRTSSPAVAGAPA